VNWTLYLIIGELLWLASSKTALATYLEPSENKTHEAQLATMIVTGLLIATWPVIMGFFVADWIIQHNKE